MMAVSPAEGIKILGKRLIDNTEAAKNFSYFINDYFINAVVNGEEDLNYLDTLERHNKDSSNFVVHENWKNKVDFIGIDYYRRVYVYHSSIVALSSARFVGGALVNNLHFKNEQPHGILNDLGWEIYPKGLHELIMHLNQWRNIPVLITENGIADRSDRYRAPFIVAHLEETRRAIDNDAHVIGYLHWSFMDNYEWLDGYKPEAKFGLFRIDYSESNEAHKAKFERQITKGAEALKFIIEESIFQHKNVPISNIGISRAREKFGEFTADGSKLILPKRT
jgi:beta-glucosidase